MARILLDTHVLLWLVDGGPRLTTEAKKLIRDAERVFVSAATIWEVAIKVRLGKLRVNPDELIEEMQRIGLEELPVYARHAKEVAKLPLYHRDPFDRLIVAQAKTDMLRLVTNDAQLTPYSDLVVLI
ncbi:MAG: type II toxin-antitoxin system VapC family toxin [Terracidiphilus sp.]|jgi:PIN domain nuclease of toxin-antitoxin system